MSIFDFANRLSANANEFAQQRLRQESFAAQALEALGSFGFFPRPLVHFFRPL
jgi:hypothetical protein